MQTMQWLQVKPHKWLGASDNVSACLTVNQVGTLVQLYANTKPPTYLDFVGVGQGLWLRQTQTYLTLDQAQQVIDTFGLKAF